MSCFLPSHPRRTAPTEKSGPHFLHGHLRARAALPPTSARAAGAAKVAAAKEAAKAAKEAEEAAKEAEEAAKEADEAAKKQAAEAAVAKEAATKKTAAATAASTAAHDKFVQLSVSQLAEREKSIITQSQAIETAAEQMRQRHRTSKVTTTLEMWKSWDSDWASRANAVEMPEQVPLDEIIGDLLVEIESETAAKAAAEADVAAYTGLDVNSTDEQIREHEQEILTSVIAAVRDNMVELAAINEIERCNLEEYSKNFAAKRKRSVDGFEGGGKRSKAAGCDGV